MAVDIHAKPQRKKIRRQAYLCDLASYPTLREIQSTKRRQSAAKTIFPSQKANPNTKLISLKASCHSFTTVYGLITAQTIIAI